MFTRHLFIQKCVSTIIRKGHQNLILSCVAVISNKGIRLMPTSNYRARKLLTNGKAVIYKHNPFTIQLVTRSDGEKQPIECAIDTGYYHVGNSIKTKKHEIAAIEIRTLSDEKQRRDDRRMYRRQRRSRLRYRKARFNNRRRKENWLAPSIEHRMEQNIAVLNKSIQVIPITDITMEMGQFDTQILKAIEEGRPLPQGVDYQRGERYGMNTLREAVFTRDGYTCQCCGKSIKDGVILRVHHIIYRNNGGTNRMSNLIAVCTKCHTSENHKPGGKLYGWNSKIKSFKGATFMTSVRWILYRKVKTMYPGVNMHLTYGADTKGRRRERNISKSHVNDAYVMGIFHPKHRAHPIILQKKRRNNRILEKFYDAKYIDSRDRKKKSGQQLFNGRTSRNYNTDTENLHKYRKCKVSSGRRSIRSDRYVIQPHDKILYQGKILDAAGCHCKGTRIMVGKKSLPIKKIKLKQYSGGYYTVTE